MRPTRLLLSVCFVFVLVVLTLYSLVFTQYSDNVASTPSGSKRSVKALFSWSMPSTLFPQSAIISLTDDNSTFFLSRPAAYGPLLPTDGLSGQVWVGGGFNDELLANHASSPAEGELGCSDMPGWDQRQVPGLNDATDSTKPASKEGSSQGQKDAQKKQGQSGASTKDKDTTASNKTPQPKADDGTDDHLHWPLHATPLNRYRKSGDSARNGQDEHADIQSLQESAEIAGKVVLLSRGGCGFLEKTKWVQRRGGVALIVGDNTRGGPLTTMYGSGDTSNITIPSVFTTRTTAHLLYSLMPDGSDGSEGVLKVEEVTGKLTQSSKDSSPGKMPAEKTSTSPPNDSPKNSESKGSSGATKVKKRSPLRAQETKKEKIQHPGWFSWLPRFVFESRDASVSSDSSRPPSSGQLQWIVSEDWEDEPRSESPKKTEGKGRHSMGKQSKEKSSNPDSFVIGVQDWRDPDMMNKGSGAAHMKEAEVKAKDSKSAPGSMADSSNDKKLSGGSHTPGSGVYHQQDDKAAASGKELPKKAESEEQRPAAEDNDNGWLGSLFSSSAVNNDQEAAASSNRKAKVVYEEKIASKYVKEKEFQDTSKKTPSEHEGLWVTLTPTTVSTTPFFDTLLVLVVSPLVTLTIVYALLLLRSRIRRRRWRAPKSVVDQLPVRTYHTMSYSSSSSSEPSSPEGSSPTSPLLSTHSKSANRQSRPRSRTTSTLAEHVSSSLDKATATAGLLKGSRQRFAQKRYQSRHSECVVCLEEYVDGQSRVMSLPCGHEFHAECMYVNMR